MDETVLWTRLYCGRDCLAYCVLGAVHETACTVHETVHVVFFCLNAGQIKNPYSATPVLRKWSYGPYSHK